MFSRTRNFLLGFLILSVIFAEILCSIENSYGNNHYNDEDSYGEQSKCGKNSPCLYASGLNANPNDCCSFYNCDKCRAFYQKCGPKTHFNPKKKICDFPETAGCKAYNRDCHKIYGYVWKKAKQSYY